MRKAMKKLLFALLLVLTFSSISMAEETAKAPAAPAVAAAAPAVTPAAPVASPAATATVETPKADSATTEAAPAPEDAKKITEEDMKEILANADEVLSAYRSVKDANGSKAKMFAIFAALAIVFKLLLSLLKVVVKVEFWKGAKAKWILRCVTAALGLAVFLFASLGTGTPWYDAVVLGLSGPFAIVVHEFTSKPRISEAKKA